LIKALTAVFKLFCFGILNPLLLSLHISGDFLNKPWKGRDFLMKDYVKPTITLILLKTEERLAASTCPCSGIINGVYSPSAFNT
jgi:hypothetical protein